MGSLNRTVVANFRNNCPIQQDNYVSSADFSY